MTVISLDSGYEVLLEFEEHLSLDGARTTDLILHIQTEMCRIGKYINCLEFLTEQQEERLEHQNTQLESLYTIAKMIKEQLCATRKALSHATTILDELYPARNVDEGGEENAT
ncbi:hypothetical protein HBI56_198990 [Parastagonospora nodorum]|nr:hypothetical protein HBH53_201470 [Parastagonospora nodorum]KAH3959580.1 hypothetical protein HBH51_199070 [Parastagonospora nodorum]KAH3963988.1 hypothetical protein HBH52_214580 [Parastagonospora nodorum]KAH3992864.1 hypothetical protein HBI10_209980 [Parastagonospora nodorum]KAH4010700.1 hypothetical protein HBI13_206220 [Parastagonospora nodorum]